MTDRFHVVLQFSNQAKAFKVRGVYTKKEDADAHVTVNTTEGEQPFHVLILTLEELTDFIFESRLGRAMDLIDLFLDPDQPDAVPPTQGSTSDDSDLLNYRMNKT